MSYPYLINSPKTWLKYISICSACFDFISCMKYIALYIDNFYVHHICDVIETTYVGVRGIHRNCLE